MNIGKPSSGQGAPPPAYPVPLAEDIRPVDIWGRIDPPALPSELLPGIIRDFAIQQSAMIGCDPGGMAMAALTVCAAAIPDSVTIQVRVHSTEWQESPRLWTMLIGMPSTKKSPIVRAAQRPIAKLDGERFRAWQMEMQRWEALDREERKGVPKPLQQRLRLSDVTVEAAQDVFLGTHTGLLITADELSGWFGALDKYSGSKGASADRAFWLQAWNGGEMPVNRVGRGAFLLPNVSASVIGGIQPDAIQRVTHGAVDDGLLQRYLPVMLQPASQGIDAPASDIALLYDMHVRIINRACAPMPLRFDPGAQRIRMS